MGRLVRILALGAVAGFGAPGLGAEEPVTFTVFSADLNPQWNQMRDEVGRAITAKTGVTLKIEFPVGSADQRIALIAASGQYPDLIMPKGQTAALVEAGALIDLTDLIAQHAPNLRRMLGDQLGRLRYSASDPSIYFIPNIEGVGTVSFDTDALFKVQLDALREAGYPRIETLADFERVIADSLRRRPLDDQGRPRIGLSLLADDWRIVISTTNPAVYATGLRDDGEWAIDPVTYEAREHYFRPEEREYFRWLNHMNAVGLLDRESFFQKYGQYKAKIAEGRVVALIDADWNIQDAVNQLLAAGREGQTYGRFPAVLRPGIRAAYRQSTGFIGGWGIAITKRCADPVRAIQFLDWLASDEGQVLNFWGIAGKHYQVVNGRRVIPPEVQQAKSRDPNTFFKSTGIGSYTISLHYGDGVLDPTGNSYTTRSPQLITEGYNQAEKAALRAYGVTFWGDLLPPAKDFPTVPWGRAWSIPIPEDSILRQHWDKEQAVVRRWIPEAILVRPQDFDRTYSAFLRELEATTGHMAAAESALIRDRVRLWTEGNERFSPRNR